MGGIDGAAAPALVDRPPDQRAEAERAAAIARTELTLAEVATRLEVFRIESGRYPRELAELLVPTDNFPRGYLERAALRATERLPFERFAERVKTAG